MSFGWSDIGMVISMHRELPILQLVGYKNSGKTTLLVKIIVHLKKEYGLNIASLKHDSHEFSLDNEGKDTWRHREAGAQLSLIQSPTGLGLTMQQENERPLFQLSQLVQSLGNYDMIIVEGFKKEAYPKIVLIRNQEDFELIEKLQKIEALVFCRDEDFKSYKQGSVQGERPSYLSFYRENDDQILAWIEAFWLSNIGGKA